MVAVPAIMLIIVHIIYPTISVGALGRCASSVSGPAPPLRQFYPDCLNWAMSNLRQKTGTPYRNLLGVFLVVCILSSLREI